MSSKSRSFAGFTVIELMVTVAVVVVLMMIAIPSFQAFRQRNALRAAADQSLVLWNQARFEAAKRNSHVKFAMQTNSGNACLGVATATGPTDNTACDCFTNGACNIAQFPTVDASLPAGQAQWNGVALGAPTSSTLGVVVIEPKRTFLATGSSPGRIAFTGPTTGPNSYKLYMNIDTAGRAVLCEPSDATHKMSEYNSRSCTP